MKQSPWYWVPTLYFAEGIPYFMVNTISTILYKNLGMSNAVIAALTSMIYLPWVIKPLWSPFVDVIKTKRWWILVTELLMTASFVALALAIPSFNGAVPEAGTAPVSLFTATLVIFWITAFASATHDIAADGFYMLALSESNQSLFVGVRSTFYRLSSIFGQGVIVVIAGILEQKTENIPLAWRLTMLITALIFGAVTLYHCFFVPRPSSDSQRLRGSAGKSLKVVFGDIVEAFRSFFSIKGIVLSMVFLLLYRFPEALLIKLVNPFLLDSTQAGGMALTTGQVGLVYGTIGTIGLTLGGIIGGVAASRWGLRKSLIPMAAALTLPCVVYVFLAASQTSSIFLVSSAIFFEQFGYGFGFTAYMLYMMYISRGEFKTSHYSLCTAFMALSMMIPGFFSGWIEEALGYYGFFIFVMLCCLVTFAVTVPVAKKVPSEYGKK